MASSNDGKGVAFEKRAKIDSIQKQVLTAVCLSSIVVGGTLTASLFMIGKISFNGKLMKANDYAIESYKKVQKDLKQIESSVSALAGNENFESVALKRDPWCADFAGKTDIHGLNEDDLSRVRTCSSLRVISDALPSRANNEALLSSLNSLINMSNNGNGVGFKGISGSTGGMVGTSIGYQQIMNPNLHAVNSSVSFEDSSESVRSALDVIENSIRNYDIVNAKMSWASEGRIELAATFSSYYSSGASLKKMKRVMCADPKSEDCASKGGDTELSEENSGQEFGDGSIEVVVKGANQ